MKTSLGITNGREPAEIPKIIRGGSDLGLEKATKKRFPADS
jgi:hypothetical protein